MPNEYQNILTDLVKRVRPLLVSISEKTVINVIENGAGGGVTITANPIWIPVMAGYDYTAATQIFVGQTVFSISPGIGLDASNDLEGTGTLKIGVAGTITITPVVRIDPVTTGDVRMQAACHSTPAGTSGLSGQEDSDSVAATTISLPAYSGTNPHWEITGLNQSLTITAGAVVTVFTRRVGSNGADTYNGYLDLKGWKIVFA